MAKKKKSERKLCNIFTKARRKHKKYSVIQLRRASDHLALSNMNTAAQKALEEVREASRLIGSPTVPIYDPDHIRGTGDWSERQMDVYMRYKDWCEQCSKSSRNTKARDAVLHFVKGESLRGIDRLLKVRNGQAKDHFKRGLWLYCHFSGWIKIPDKPVKPRQVRRDMIPLQDITHIIIFED